MKSVGAWPAARATPLALALLLLARLALGAAYSLVVPVWEAYDEDGHYFYVRYLAKYRQLLDPADPEAQFHENFQPPLYYLLVAPFVMGYDLGDTRPAPALNPLFANGNAGLNYALHPPALTGQEAETARAVHTARLVSVVISTLSVLAVYHLARRVWDRRSRPRPGPVWAATVLYAFWPQYLFNGSMISNDLLVTALSAGILALAVQLVTEGFRARRTLGLALLLAAAVLTKINALALLPVAVLAVAMSLTPVLRQARWRSPRPWLVLLALVGVVAAALYLLSSLDFVTSQVLQTSTLLYFLNNLGQPEAQASLRTAALYGFRTFFASFGWGNVETRPWLYDVWAVGFGLGLLGLALGAARRRLADGRALLLLGLTAAGMLLATLGLVVASGTIHLAPGRYLLPALPAVIILLVEGWRMLLEWAPARLRPAAWKGLALGAVLLGWAMPLATLIPTYAVPPPLDGAVDVPARYAFGEHILLIGHQNPAPAQPGEDAAVSVCWEASAPVPENYTVFLEAVGPDGQGYGRLLTYPGRGNYATSFWTPGVPFCDRYRLPIEAAMPAPGQAWVRVTLLRAADVNGERLPLTSAEGQRVPLDAYSLPLKIEAAGRPAAPDHALHYRFGEALRLRGYSLALDPATRSLRVSLQWEALRDLDHDYVVFVHLRETPTSLYTQADSAPRAGWYPTHLWRRGEVVEDVHVLALPEGAASSPPLGLYVGVVQPDAEARLPVVDASGAALANNELILFEGWVVDERWALPAVP